VSQARLFAYKRLGRGENGSPPIFNQARAAGSIKGTQTFEIPFVSGTCRFGLVERNTLCCCGDHLRTDATDPLVSSKHPCLVIVWHKEDIQPSFRGLVANPNLMVLRTGR
jgi:hypothetical protein